MIDKLRGIFDGQVVKTFSKKKAVVTFKGDEQAIEFEEEHRGSALRKLSIIYKGVLIKQQLPDTVIVEADFATGEYAKYSSFVKSDAFFLTKQCDLFIFHQKADKLYVAICDMKSSKAGNDSRCAEQIKHAEFFLTYILDSAMFSEKIKAQAITTISEYIFIKVLFIPTPNLSIAIPLPVNLEDDNSNPPFKPNGETNFYLLDMGNGGTHAIESWQNIESRFPL